MSRVTLEQRARRAAGAVRDLADTFAPALVVPVTAAVARETPADGGPRREPPRHPRRPVALIPAAALVVAVALVAGLLARDRDTAPPVDLTEMPVRAATTVGRGATGLVVGAKWVWVARGDTLLRVDPNTEKVLSEIPLGDRYDGPLAAAGGSVWLTRVRDGGVELARLDPASEQIAQTWPLDLAGAADVEVNAAAAWVADTGSARLARIDRNTGEVSYTDLPSAEAGSVLQVRDLFLLNGHLYVHAEATVDGRTQLHTLAVADDRTFGQQIFFDAEDAVLTTEAGSLWLAWPSDRSTTRLLQRAEQTSAGRPVISPSSRSYELPSGVLTMAATREAVWLLDPDGRLSRLDRATGLLDAPRDLPGPARPASTTTLVADRDGSSLWLLDSANGRLLHLTDPGPGPADAAQDVCKRPREERATCPEIGGGELTLPDDSNDSAMTRVHTIALDGAPAPDPVAVLGDTLWTVASTWDGGRASAHVRSVDPLRGSTLATIDVDQPSVHSIGAGTVGGADQVWVVGGGGGEYSTPTTVIRIDPATGHVVLQHELVARQSCGGCTVTVGAGGVWLGGAGYDRVLRLDPDTGEVAAVVDIGEAAAHAVAVAGEYVVLSGLGFPIVTVIDPATNRVAARIRVTDETDPPGMPPSVAALASLDDPQAPAQRPDSAIAVREDGAVFLVDAAQVTAQRVGDIRAGATSAVAGETGLWALAPDRNTLLETDSQWRPYRAHVFDHDGPDFGAPLDLADLHSETVRRMRTPTGSGTDWLTGLTLVAEYLVAIEDRADTPGPGGVGVTGNASLLIFDLLGL